MSLSPIWMNTVPTRKMIRNRIFGIRHQGTFFHSALHPPLQHLTQTLPQSLIQHLLAHFGMEITWYLHSHRERLKFSYSSIRKLLLVCLAAHALEFLGWAPENVKLLLPSRLIRWNSRVTLVAGETCLTSRSTHSAQ